ncbi:hypothetical protein BDA96_09G128000 [Sorghum bicolor]|uniref:Uncharacterized protein n=1 Tax=Sorghum bicolor TaxID=4558 RepID=A0A921Q9T8_SORBI|nr:hypothetical protein BDA96_09G128000 [Sorghum bicolor]
MACVRSNAAGKQSRKWLRDKAPVRPSLSSFICSQPRQSTCTDDGQGSNGRRKQARNQESDRAPPVVVVVTAAEPKVSSLIITSKICVSHCGWGRMRMSSWLAACLAHLTEPVVVPATATRRRRRSRCRRQRRRGGRRRAGCSRRRRSRSARGGTGRRRRPPCRWRSGWAPASSPRPGTCSTTPAALPCRCPRPEWNHRRRRQQHLDRPPPRSPAGSTSSRSRPSARRRRRPPEPPSRRRPSRRAARPGSPWPPPRASPAASSCAAPASAALVQAPPLPPPRVLCRTTKKKTRRPRRERRPTGRAASAAGARLHLHPRPHHWAGSPRPHTCNRQETVGARGRHRRRLPPHPPLPRWINQSIDRSIKQQPRLAGGAGDGSAAGCD